MIDSVWTGVGVGAVVQAAALFSAFWVIPSTVPTCWARVTHRPGVSLAVGRRASGAWACLPLSIQLCEAALTSAHRPRLR